MHPNAHICLYRHWPVEGTALNEWTGETRCVSHWGGRGGIAIDTTMTQAPEPLPLSVDLKVGRGGSVSPLVHLVRDGCSAQRTRLLPVEPQSDALVTENMLWRKQTG